MANGVGRNNHAKVSQMDHSGAPSRWVRHFLAQAAPGGNGPVVALDVAAGRGRHTRLALDLGWRVTAIDRDVAGLADLAGESRAEIIAADLEDGSPWPLAGRTFDAVIVTNYLYRPRLPAIVAAVGPSGVLIYETFARGHERFGRPSNSDFLLAPGELLAAVAGHLTPFAFEYVFIPESCRIVQRIAAAGPVHGWQTSPPEPFGSLP